MVLILLNDLCNEYDIIFVQENCLFPQDLNAFNDFRPNDKLIIGVFIGNGKVVEHGQTYGDNGGVGILVRSDILDNFKCVVKKDKVLNISLGKLLIVHVHTCTYFN